MKAAIAILSLVLLAGCAQQYNYDASTFKMDDISIVWLGHASFMIETANRTIYIDPYVLPANPKTADLILVTHDHFDHLGTEQVKQIRGDRTVLFGTTAAVRKVAFGNPVSDSASFEWQDIQIRSTKAYNTDKIDSYGKPYHENGSGNGYIIEIDGKRIYHAGDTDYIPEMNSLGDIDVALIPIGGKYTMDVDNATAATRSINPSIVIPMHFDSERYGIRGIESNPAQLILGLAGTEVEVKVLEQLVK